MDEKIKNIEKYNFWNNNNISIGFCRNTYIDKIDSYLGNRLVNIVVW